MLANSIAVLTKMLFVFFFSMLDLIPCCGPVLPPWITIQTNSNLHCLIIPHTSFSFLTKQFLRRFFFCLYLCKNSTSHCDPTLSMYPRDYILDKLESKLHEDTSAQVPVFLAKWFLKRRFFFIFCLFICKNSTRISCLGQT